LACGTNLLELRNRGLLDDKRFNNLVEDQQALMGKKRSEETILGDKAAVDMVLKGAGIQTGERGDPKMLGSFYERFDQRLRAMGENVPQQQKIDLARELLKEVTVERPMWFDTTKRAFELTGDESVVVPSDEVPKIKAFLKSKGLPDNEANVRRLYVESLR
jgi:predicted RNA binding protein with dsRBD fold (UPF0201 family)